MGRGKVTKPHKPMQQRSRERVGRMITTYGELLDKHGYAGVTTTMVTLEADCAVGSFYQYFADKDGITLALRDRYVAWVADQVVYILAGEHVDIIAGSREGITLEDGFVALFEAIEQLHRTQPGARHVPLLAETLAETLMGVLGPFSNMPYQALKAHILVAAATSAAVVKMALTDPDLEEQMLMLGRWTVRELSAGRG